MARKCKWTPKSPMQRRSAAQDRAAWRGWHSVRACTDPWWRTLPANGITDADMHRSYSFYVMGYRNDGCDKRNRDLALYAAALGQKRGVLPIDLSGVRATIMERTYQEAMVVFERDTAGLLMRSAWETIASGRCTT
jgi:hypothetical protein